MNMKAKTSKIILIFGIIFIVLSLIVLMISQFMNPEKPQAIYYWGHWFDIEWEIGIPLLIISLVLFTIYAKSVVKKKNEKNAA